MKIKHFSHKDLDGAGSDVVLRILFPGEDIDTVFTQPNLVSKLVSDFLESPEYKEYKALFISDLSVDSDVAEKLDRDGIFKALHDHHPTADFLRFYPWAQVVQEWFGFSDIAHRTSATEVFYICNQSMLPPVMDKDKVFDFVRTVTLYDTYAWKKIGDMHAKDVNDLCYIIGIEEFVDKVVNNLVNGRDAVTEGDLELVRYRQKEEQQYIKDKEPTLVECEINGRKVGVVFAERFLSELGDYLGNKNPHLDYIAMVYAGRNVSLRSIHDHINLGETVAKPKSGGGHPQAAGFPMTNDDIKKLFDLAVNILS